MLFKLYEDAEGISSEKFGEEFCKHPLVKEFASEFEKNHNKMMRFLPFESDRDFKNLHLLYPAWSARELAVNQNINSQMSRLWIYGKYPKNFVTCLIDGDIAFILGFTPVEGRDAIELALLSGKPLKKNWSHKFADIFSIFLSVLLKSFPDHWVLASCYKEFPLYEKFTESFGFSFWENYEAYGHTYGLFIFKAVL